MYSLACPNEQQTRSRLQSVNIADDWIEKLLKIDKDDLTLILGELANRGNIDNHDFKKARSTLSFSDAKWDDFAQNFKSQLSHPRTL